MPYEEWLVVQGLVKLQNEGENIHKINDVKNTEKDSHSGSLSVKDDSKDGDNHSEVKSDSVNKNEDEDDEKDKTQVMVSKMDEMKKDIKELLAKGNGEAQSMDRINILGTIYNCCRKTMKMKTLN